MEHLVPSIVYVCTQFCGDIHLLDLLNHERMLRGLENLGNTCYLNSSLQLLASSKPFIECLCSCNYVLRNDPGAELRSSCSFTHSLIELVESTHLI